MKNTPKTDSSEASNAFWNIPAEQQLKQLNYDSSRIKQCGSRSAHKALWRKPAE